jgi:hypothetical protein
MIILRSNLRKGHIDHRLTETKIGCRLRSTVVELSTHNPKIKGSNPAQTNFVLPCCFE